MTVEDLILFLNNSRLVTNFWDKNVVASLSSQLQKGLGFTEKQSKLAINLILKNQKNLLTHSNIDVAILLQNPQFKLPFRVALSNKKIISVDDSTYGKIAKITFPYDVDIIGKIKDFTDTTKRPVWDNEEKCWKVVINEISLKFLRTLIIDDKFDCDEFIEGAINQINEIEKNLENYIPMLVIEDNNPTLKNCSKFVPKIESENWLEAVFEARKRAVTTWDEQISKFLDSPDISLVTNTFLKMPLDHKLRINSTKFSIDSLNDIFIHLSPCLFIIPVSVELEKIKIIYEWLKRLNVDPDEISVMFRLDNKEDNGFNEYVRENKLNASISEKTKAVIISGKLRKPIIASQIKFNSVIHFGYGMVHNTIREFAGKHHNFIYFHEKSLQEDIDVSIV